MRYGRSATLALLAVILVRLMNEVWSNTAVAGAYFGAQGTPAYFGGALVFTAITLAHSLRGGLRGSILTDLLQLGLGVFLLVFVLAILVPRAGALWFHLAFWPCVAIGVLHALNRIPGAWVIGGGPNAALLGANVVGTITAFAGFAPGHCSEGACRRTSATGSGSGRLR